MTVSAGALSILLWEVFQYWVISGFVMRVFLKAQNCFLVRRSHTLTVGVNMMVSLEFLFELFFNEFKKRKNWQVWIYFGFSVIGTLSKVYIHAQIHVYTPINIWWNLHYQVTPQTDAFGCHQRGSGIVLAGYLNALLGKITSSFSQLVGFLALTWNF